MKKIVFALLLFLTHYTCFAQENAQFINEKATNYAKAKNYKESLKEYNKCVKYFENESRYFKVDVLVNKAKIENNLNEFKLAEKSIQEAITIKKNIHTIYVTQADIFAKQNKCLQAVAAIDSALFYNKNEVELLIRKADLQLRGLQPDSAIQTINKYINLEPKNLLAYVVRSSIFIQKKEYQKGLSDVDFALSKNPDLLEAILNRGILLSFLEKYDKAETDFHRIIDLNNQYKFASINNLVFFIKFRNKDFGGAIDILNKALLESPNEPFLMNNRGYAHLRLNNYKEAEKDITASLALNPFNSYAYKYLALYYLAQNKKSKACDCLKNAESLGYTKEHDNEVQDLLKTKCK